MSNSSSPSESMGFAMGLGLLLVVGAGMHWWQVGCLVLTLLWFVGSVGVLFGLTPKP